MSTSTPNLQLPYIQAAQAQKHVTHNDAVRALDAIVQLAVIARDLAAPPAAPNNGDRYLVAASASGAWAGKAGLVAAFQDGAWAFLTPQPGWLVWVQAESLLIVWNGTAWGAAVAQPTLNPTPLVGINATADTTNRLAVKAPASLFDNAGNGHQLKVNKAHAADTASLLFQESYAGHAEMGLTGDDNFHVKVSADGAAWTEAIVINNATGQVSFPHTTLASSQVNADWAASSGAAQILNKPALGSAAALNAGTVAGNLVALDSSGKLPAVDGSQLLNITAGATGPAGPAGPTGPAGPAGAQGPAGAAGGVYTVSPSYSNAGGQGARSSLIAVTAASGMLNATAPAQNLVDGVTGANTATNATWFASSTITVGASTWFLFDFGALSAKIITEVTWLQSGTQSHGVWQWYGSNDGVTFAALGANFTLGGATSQVQTTLSANSASYRYYKLGGVSGTVSGGPYLYEIQFKIAGTVLDGVPVVPTGGSAGQILTQQASGVAAWANNSALPTGGTVGQVMTQTGSGTPAWANVAGDPYGALPVSGLLAHYKFNELSGTQCLDSIGTYPIDLTLPASQSVAWTMRGLKSTGGLIQTPSIPNARMVAMLYRVKREETGNFLLSGGNGSGNGCLIDGSSTTYTYTIGSGFGIVHPLVYRSNGGNTHELNRGGWLLLICDFNAAYTTPLGFGGRYGVTTSRCSEFELAWAGVWNRSLTAAEQASVYGVMRKVALGKGFYLALDDCTRQADGVVMFGESTMSGRAPLSGLSASDQALAFHDTLIQTGLKASNTTNYARPHRLELGFNQMLADGSYTAAANFGPEFGFAVQQRSNQLSRRRPVYILKAGLGSTYLSPAWATAGTSWSNTDTTKSSLYYYLLRMIYDLEQGLRLDGSGLTLASLMMMLGLNDASATTYAPDSSTYQGFIQSFFTQLQGDLGLGALPKMVIWQAHSPCTGADATALANVRAGQAAFVTANASNAALITTDAYTKIADGVHFDAPGCKQAGIDGYTATGL